MPGEIYRTVSANDVPQSLKDPRFIFGEYVLKIKDPQNLPGFSHNLTLDVLGDDVVKNLLKDYPAKINIRRYDAEWKVSFSVSCLYLSEQLVSCSNATCLGRDQEGGRPRSRREIQRIKQVEHH